jgi:F-type H+-transporting ATPase subunit b
MITFALFVWFTMKYVWPPIMKALADRQNKIAEGLAAAERSVHQLELAKHKIAEQLREAKGQAAEILEIANRRSAQLIEEAKKNARDEGERLIVLAQAEIVREVETAKQHLRKQVADIALAGAEQILGQHIDAKANQDLLAKLINELSSNGAGRVPAATHIFVDGNNFVHEKGVTKI